MFRDTPNDPILQLEDVDDIRFCALHAVMSFGRIMLNFIYSSIYLLIQKSQTRDTSFVTKVQNIFNNRKIKVEIDAPPANGTWNIKGVHTIRLMHCFEEVATVIKRTDTVPVIAKVLQCFQAMFIIDTTAPGAQPQVEWFVNNVNKAVSDFATLFSPANEYNYVHQIQHHSSRLMEHGGIGVYSNDIIETMNYLCKQMYLHLSNRGGTKGGDWMQMAMERHFITRHVQLLSGNINEVVKLTADKKKLKQFLRELNGK